MFSRRRKGKKQQTRPDHRPMLPELREPRDPLDTAVRGACRVDSLIDPKKFINWR